MNIAVPLVVPIHKIIFLHHFSLPAFGVRERRRRDRLFPACGVEKNSRKNLYVHPHMWLSSLLSHRAFLSGGMVGSFSQRVGNGSSRKSEQKPLILCFLAPDRLQGARYLSPSSDVALRALSDATQTSQVMLVKGKKQIASDMSTGNNTQARHLPMPLGKGPEREMRLDWSGVEP